MYKITLLLWVLKQEQFSPSPVVWSHDKFAIIIPTGKERVNSFEENYFCNVVRLFCLPYKSQKLQSQVHPFWHSFLFYGTESCISSWP